MSVIAESLGMAYGGLGRGHVSYRNLYLATEVLRDKVEHDLILLGGAKNNKITAEFLRLLAHQQPAVQEDGVLIWRERDGDGDGKSARSTERAHRFTW
jgi:hypothetical protein